MEFLGSLSANHSYTLSGVSQNSRGLKLRPLLVSVLLASGMATTCVHASETVLLEKCGKAADGFTFMVDVSGSMMKTIGDVKAEANNAYEALAAEGQPQARNRPVPPANEQIDDLRRVSLAKVFVKEASNFALSHTDMTAGLYSVAPFTVMAKNDRYDKDAFNDLIDRKLVEKLEVFGRPSWLGQRGADYLKTPVQGAQSMIIVTDGDFDLKTEGKQNPAEAIQAFLKANPASCVHIVSAAYTPAEQQAIETLSQLRGCIKITELEALMTNEAIRQDFYDEVFYKDCAKVPVIELRDVYFDFDKSTLRDESKATLDKALSVLKHRDASEKITVVGWTDAKGSDVYNQGLSERRAEAVKAYLQANGIADERLEALGKGESTKYDNETEEGRFHNRRVELRFSK